MARVAWVLGAYLVGTFPSTYLVSRAVGGEAVIRAARRSAGETDAHILMAERLGGPWAAIAATLDVLKGIGVGLAARYLGDLSPGWVAAVGVAVVVGHGWPPYARSMAGRGLAAASGVFLALIPVAMVVAGVTILVGKFAFGDTSVASTIGFAAAPGVAAIQGQPGAFVAMAGIVFGLIVARRLEGVRAVVSRGVPLGRALWYRAVYDSSGPPGARVEGAP